MRRITILASLSFTIAVLACSGSGSKPTTTTAESPSCEQAEQLLVEFQDMANGAGVPYDDLMNAILHMEIRAATLKGASFLYPLHKVQDSECTTYAASGTATTDGQIILIDEVHTCDSSRFWIKDTYGFGGGYLSLVRNKSRDEVLFLSKI